MLAKNLIAYNQYIHARTMVTAAAPPLPSDQKRPPPASTPAPSERPGPAHIATRSPATRHHASAPVILQIETIGRCFDYPCRGVVFTSAGNDQTRTMIVHFST